MRAIIRGDYVAALFGPSVVELVEFYDDLGASLEHQSPTIYERAQNAVSWYRVGSTEAGVSSALGDNTTYSRPAQRPWNASTAVRTVAPGEQPCHCVWKVVAIVENSGLDPERVMT
jgi:hypothetical protein